MNLLRARQVMWRSALALVLVDGACTGSDDDMFNSLEHAKMCVNGRLADFNRTMDKFAAKKEVILGRANFPRDDRWVNNVKIDADKNERTFLTFNNFRNSAILEANVYSHEDEAK